MNTEPAIKVLLVEDDEDDFIITRELLKELSHQNFELVLEPAFKSGLEKIATEQYDVCLVDYRLGAEDGIEFIERAIQAGCQTPIIIQTGQGEHEVDMAAMKAGAADYLVKSEVTSRLMDRAIRYAVERRQAADRAEADQKRLAAFGADVGLALTSRDSLGRIMCKCTDAMLKYLKTSFALIWSYDKAADRLRLEANSGPSDCGKVWTDLTLDAGSQHLAPIKQKTPILINGTIDSTLLPSKDLTGAENIKSMAAYPLFLEDRLVGLMWVYSENSIGASIVNGMQSVASGIASCMERKRAEALIERMVAFPKYNPESVLEISHDRKISFESQAAQEKARTLGLNGVEALLPEDWPTTIAQCFEQQKSVLHSEVSRGGRTISWSLFPIATNEVVHCYGIDVTEKVELEAQLRQSQKMESIGQLASGVAHDFNNLLTIILGHTHVLQEASDDNPKFHSAAEQIASASKRASNLTRQLLSFSRKEVSRREVVDFGEVLSSLSKMLPRLLGEKVTLNLESADDLPQTVGDIGMIEQVIMNLTVNARDAMPKGGRIQVSSKLAQIDRGQTAVHSDARVGEFICLTVTDSGTGMDEATKSKIFDPFFTTKEVGKGAGLGLSTVYGIVKQHKGWIDVHSELNQGTSFEIYFPIVSPPDEEISGSIDEPVKEETGRKETVLLVEDEVELLQLEHIVLEAYNYEVLPASNGPEALEIWERHQDEIDILVSDIVMPEGVDGRELADRLKASKPGMPVIFKTGYSSDVIGNLAVDQDVLTKPYPPQDLASRIRMTLDEQSASSAERWNPADCDRSASAFF